ncbi:MAG: type II secretion system F family protein [Coriobacteriia bacterium]|nr:type II secretion system F family protein [Coriobacteriia bacterium]
MPTFAYTGTTEAGQVVTGVLEAFDEYEAMTLAREKVRVVSQIKEVRSKESGLLNMELTKPHVKTRTLAVMCKQLSIILRAGLSTPRAVELVAEQATDKYLKKVFEETARDVATGHGLADSLQNKGPELPRVLIETVRAGEESGQLAESFERLHDYYDKRSKVAAKVASALTYPIFVACIAVVVVIVMMVMVIPTILDLVSSLGSEVPAITRFLIDASNFVGENWPILLTLFVVICVGLWAWKRTEKGKTMLARAAMKVPVISPICTSSGAAQFANSMAMLLGAGLPVPRAVDITGRVISNYVLSRDVGRMVALLQEGRTLGECMAGVDMLPRTLVEMVSAGEQSGSLEECLETMGEYYDEETQRVTDKALSMLEPAMLVVMAIFAGFIVIALYLPMFTMYANM